MVIIQFIVNGVLNGGIYALIAVGIVLIYKSSKIFNFSVGSMTMLGAYLMWTLFDSFKLPLVISLVLTLLTSGFVALLMERLAIYPLIGQPLISTLLVTLGLSHILRGSVLLTWGILQERITDFLPQKVIILGDIILPPNLFWSFIVSIVAFLLLVIFYNATGAGLAMRAVAEDHRISQARGINVGNIFAIVWFVAGIVASVGGILLGCQIGVTPFMDLIGMKAFPAVLFGGLESIGGALIGGIAVGIIESLTGGIVAPWLSDTSPYIVLILVLFFRPEGLFGLRRIERI